MAATSYGRLSRILTNFSRFTSCLHENFVDWHSQNTEGGALAEVSVYLPSSSEYLLITSKYFVYSEKYHLLCMLYVSY